MNLNARVCVTCAITIFGDFVFGTTIQNCFQQDSISCLQIQVFRATKSLIESTSIDIFNGIKLVKTEDSRSESQIKKNVFEKVVEAAVDVESRQNALETYLISASEKFWHERTITWNPAETAKGLIDFIPESISNQLTNLVSQETGRKKQQILALLVALKLKLAALSAIALMAIAAIAKKAIIVAVISLVLSAISGIKSLMYSKPIPISADVMGYQAPDEWDHYVYGDRRHANYDENSLSTLPGEPAPKKKLLIGHKTS